MELRLSKREILLVWFAIIAILIAVAKLFYGSMIFSIFLIPVGIILFKEQKKKMIEKKRAEYESQLKNMLVSISDSMKIGYSMLNALKEAYRDMASSYGYDSDICKEIRLMISRMELNVSPEKAIDEFARRSNLRNAVTFSEIYKVAIRTGGNMPEIIKSVTDDIVVKERVREEIDVEITEKKLEQKVMTFIPLLLIVYVNFSSPGFLDVMYESIAGRLIMTICIIAYLIAYIWGETIVKVEQ